MRASTFSGAQHGMHVGHRADGGEPRVIALPERFELAGAYENRLIRRAPAGRDDIGPEFVDTVFLDVQ